MPDLRLRDLGAIVPGDRFSSPAPADPPARTPEAEPPVQARSVLAADTAGGPDLLGLGASLSVLAALAVHPGAETPFTLGLLGAPGTGKSSASRWLVQAIAAASKAGSAKASGKVVVAEIDAARLDGPVALVLADVLHRTLSDPYPALVAEAIHASRDPRLAAREAFEALDAARRKLAGERLALEGEEARRAGLVETVLFETAGTQIDTYARANRNRLRHRLAGLGVQGEPIRAFKQLVHRAADGLGAKIGFALRSLWAYKGQAGLLVLAFLLVLVGFGFATAEAEQAAWLPRLRDSEATRAAADWLEANIGLLDTARQVAFVGAGLALAANILRALRLVLPVLRGSALLSNDLAIRRRHADEEFGHEIRRVESLAAEVDRLARRAAEAERRAAEASPSSGLPADPSPFLDDPAKRRAERFVEAVGRLVSSKGTSRLDSHGSPIGVPDRIVVAIDNLDALEVARAREILATAHSLLGAGFVTLVAVDPGRVSGLDRWIQVPFRLGEFSARGEPAALVRAMLEPETPAPEAGRAGATVDLDAPLDEAEVRLLGELAPLAGSSPRAAKRFVNLYRLARILCPEHEGTLALMLALDAGGTEAEIEAFEQALGSVKGHLDVELRGAGPRLAEALASVRSLMGDESLEGARRAAETARLFSFRSST